MNGIGESNEDEKSQDILQVLTELKIMETAARQICLLGFGKIGQAFGAFILRAGYPVIAVDRDSSLQLAFRNGSFTTNEPGVQGILSDAFAEGQLTIGDLAGATVQPTVIIVTIPFTIDSRKSPAADDFINAILDLSGWLVNQTLLVIETSVPPGFCSRQLLPALEAAGKVHGRDYLLAHSPERIKSGSMLQQLETVPKIIGGIDQEAAEATFNLYRSFFKESNLVTVSDTSSAEMIKMAGMMYRDVNIALANQLAVFAHASKVDLVSLLPLINSDGEAALLQPGIGVGGHCTPVYPYFMIDAFRRNGLDFSLAEEARKQNESMPAFAVGLIRSEEDIRQVTVLGLSFRAGVKEDAFSPAYPLVNGLRDAGYRVFVHDPMYTPGELIERGFEPATGLYQEGSQAMVLVTMHDEYSSIDFGLLAGAGVRLLVDGRNRLDREAALAAGISYRGIGH